MRCERCGNDNTETNRFCGMCGAPLPASAPQTPASRPTPAAIASPILPPPGPAPPPAASTHAKPRPVAPSPADDAPIITGPSFLGLNKPASGSGRGDSLRPAQDHLRSSRNLDYLLEDETEEEPKRRFGKTLLVLAALALALGFGYLHWRQGGFDWLTTSTTKSSSAQPSDASQPPSNSAATPPSSSLQENTGGSAADAPSTSTNRSSPAATSPAVTPLPSSPSTVSGTNGSAAAGTAAPATPTDSDAEQSKPGGSGATAIPQPASTADTVATDPDTEGPRPKPAAAGKPTPVKPSDPVAAAEKYIYGRGVSQDCDRGLRQLKPAADQSNPKAMISLGALYATGVCAPRDLPTAYRWFALALRQQPDNDSLQENLQKIWAQMTPAERQLAIKLSQ